jgi:D-arabinose 1-dehydrogenase-like Zn-dependent alcohol dehydrogenase
MQCARLTRTASTLSSISSTTGRRSGVMPRFSSPAGTLVSTIFAADEEWFAERQVTAHNHASSTNPLISPQGLSEVARMLAEGTITARIRSTVELDGAGQILTKLRSGGLRGKAVIRL